MSGFYRIWKTNGLWYADRWYEEDPEHQGPFDTWEEAFAWATTNPENT